MWRKIKVAVRRLLDKFLGSLRLPKWFTLGDNELRYILWRSKERLERGRESYVDMARDAAMREELGLADEARYSMGDAPETFKARQKRAVENKGTVMPGLNDAKVKVVDVPKHNFTGTGKQAIEKARNWANTALVGYHTAHQIGNEFDYNIDEDAVRKFLSSSSTTNSESLGVHLAVLTQLPKVIDSSAEVEEHPDYKKVDGKRKIANGVGDTDLLVHRMYGAVNIEGDIYRVKTTMHEHYGNGNAPHDYRVTKVELLISGSPTSNALSNSTGSRGIDSNITSVALAKLLQNVEKSYDLGKKLLDESKLADEDAALYREGEDLSNLRLRPLADGEVCHLERRFNEDKSIQLTGSRAKIKSIDDMAYLFRSLEDKAVEHSFLALVKDGRATVIHTGMGNATSTTVDSSSLAVLLDAIQPDKVYFVHNHPSGSLKPSSPDLRTAENIEKMLDGRVPLECLIIDSYRHEYVSFDGLGTETYAMPEERTSNRRVQLYTFDQHVFDKDWKPSTISSAQDIAGFVASERLGERDKVCCLVLNNQNGIVGNLCPSVVSLADLDKEQLQTLVRDALLMGGKSLALDITGADALLANLVGGGADAA